MVVQVGNGSKKRPVRRFLERTVLAAMMGVVAFVVERRLLKAIRAKGAASGAANGTGGLAATPQDIDDKPTG
jgi:hypothetical protein